MKPFKKSYTRPADAKVVTKQVRENGQPVRKPFAKFKQRGGRVIEAPVSDGGTRCRVPSGKYYGRIKTVYGQQDMPLCTDLDASKEMLHQLQRKANREAAGLSDPFDESGKCSLSEHLAGFRQHLEAKVNSGRYIKEIIACTQKILDGCQFKRITDISASPVAGWLKDRRDAGEFGISTSNGYLTAFKGFCNWLVKDRRAADNPVSHLPNLNADLDVRRERRNLSAAEFSRLIEATRRNGTVCGLIGLERVMLYLSAAYTGLRASELASLSEASFDFNSEPLTVTVQAAYSKRRRKDVLPLHPDLAYRLQEWLSERRQSEDDKNPILSINGTRNTTLWPGHWAEKRRAAEMLRNDQKAAGINYRDDQDRVFDFHALRHQFISMLAADDVHPKMAQELARHSDINLTMKAYTHVGLYDLNKAVSSLPTMTMPQETAATGTDDGVGRSSLALRHGIPCPPVSTDDHAAASCNDDQLSKPAAEDSLKKLVFDRECSSLSIPDDVTREDYFEPSRDCSHQIPNRAKHVVVLRKGYCPLCRKRQLGHQNSKRKT